MGFFFYKNDGREEIGGPSEVAPVGSITFTALPMSGSAQSESEALSAPDGFLFCNGALISALTYPDLYGVIGNNFGGTYPNFRLPDYRNYFPTSTGGSYLLGVASAGGSHAHDVDSHTHTVNSHSHDMPAGYLTHEHSMNHAHTLSNHRHPAGDASGKLYSGVGDEGINAQAPNANIPDTQARETHTHGDLTNYTDYLSSTVTTSTFNVDTGGPVGSVSITGYSSVTSEPPTTSVSLTAPSPSSLPPYLGINFIMRYI